MSQYAIQVEHLSKSYRIRQGERAGYTALRDVLSERTGRFFGRLAKGKNPFQGEETHEEFWALNDVSFNVEHGEVLGIIGRNGAGKSTLLKLLSRITEPDKGKITLNGRVASLLEVGTGFHPELTGRENIYLSGAILGMRREEIKKRFDEIVDFAGVEKFLDTPVKRYSSGMYVRLGFAVAAHLETEILLVDEVLAVGDVEFQRRCVGKMSEVSKLGKTTLIVSHNLGIIKKLCTRCLVLKNGIIELLGQPQDSIDTYLNHNASNSSATWTNPANKEGKVFLHSMEVRNEDGFITGQFLNNQKIFVHFFIEALTNLSNFTIAVDLLRRNEIVLRSRQVDSSRKDILVKGEMVEFIFEIPQWFLNAGEYYIQPSLSVHCLENLFDNPDAVLRVSVSLDPARSKYHNALNESNHPGMIFPSLNWDYKLLEREILN